MCLHEDRKQEGNMHGGLESSQSTAGKSDKSDGQGNKPQKQGSSHHAKAYVCTSEHLPGTHSREYSLTISSQTKERINSPR